MKIYLSASNQTDNIYNTRAKRYSKELKSKYNIDTYIVKP